MTDQTLDEQHARRQAMPRVAGAVLLGSALEWYDYFLYGTAAALVFDSVFFPNQSETVSLLLSFATFGVGFFARPVGAVVFGHLGDKAGRKPALVATLLLMGLATAGMALIPSYATIGLWAPILLVVLRLLQGMGSGAEYSGASVFATEYAPTRQRGFFSSFAGSGVYAGLFLSSVFVLLMTSVTTDAAFLDWGWRIPFLASVVLIAVGLYIRMKIDETPAFERAKEQRQEARVPLVALFRTEWRSALLVMGVVAAPLALSYVYQVYALSYFSQIGLPTDIGTTSLIVGGIAAVIIVPVAGALSDRWGRRPILMAGAIFSAAYAFPFFWLVDTQAEGLIWVAMALAHGVSVGLMFGVQGVILSELFATRTRYSGAAVSREIASVIFGGLSPLIAVSLAASAGGASWPVSIYVIVLSAITLGAAVAVPETYRTRIDPDQGDTPVTSGAPTASSNSQPLVEG